VRRWALDAPGHIREIVARVNRARRENPALQYDHTLRFLDVDNDHLLAYLKRSPDGANVVIVVVNLDPHHAREATLRLPLDVLGVAPDESFQVHDLLGDARYLWQGERNYVRLDPRALPAHLFVLRRKVATEKDFDYYL
jgi:starch synthase (maltosyl-transferring)